MLDKYKQIYNKVQQSNPNRLPFLSSTLLMHTMYTKTWSSNLQEIIDRAWTKYVIQYKLMTLRFKSYWILNGPWSPMDTKVESIYKSHFQWQA